MSHVCLCACTHASSNARNSTWYLLHVKKLPVCLRHLKILHKCITYCWICIWWHYYPLEKSFLFYKNSECWYFYAWHHPIWNSLLLILSRCIVRSMVIVGLLKPELTTSCCDSYVNCTIAMFSTARYHKERNLWDVSDPFFLLMLLSVHQGAGLGRIKPNVVMIGFKKDWRSDTLQAAHNYIGILQWVERELVLRLCLYAFELLI